MASARRDSTHAIPALAHWRLSSLPRYLQPEDVERVIGSCSAGTSAGIRDRAIVLLLARVGLRAGGSGRGVPALRRSKTSQAPVSIAHPHRSLRPSGDAGSPGWLPECRGTADFVRPFYLGYLDRLRVLGRGSRDNCDACRRTDCRSELDLAFIRQVVAPSVLGRERLFANRWGELNHPRVAENVKARL
jgi:hypothetical protein